MNEKDIIENLRFSIYGENSLKNITVSELMKLDDECIARVENSGSEGYYVEIARWNPNINKYQRYAFHKFLGGEIPDTIDLICAEKVVDHLNNNWNVDKEMDFIHHLDDWKSESEEGVTIDLNKIKEAMKKNGYIWNETNRLDGWTDALVDALEQEYNLETLLIDSFSKETERNK